MKMLIVEFRTWYMVQNEGERKIFSKVLSRIQMAIEVPQDSNDTNNDGNLNRLFLSQYDNTHITHLHLDTCLFTLLKFSPS